MSETARERRGSALRHPERMALLVALAWLGAACAQHAGGRATQGAIEALRAQPPEGTPTLASRVGRETANGALAELSSPEGIASISRVVDATVRRSLEAALQEPPGVPGQVGGGPGGSLVERASRGTAAAFAAAFTEELRRELGPDGRGPLATSLGATAAQVSGGAIQGARSELDAFFPGCEGQDRRVCLEAGVRSLGKAAAVGFVEGMVESASWGLIALAFLVGVVAVLAVQGTVLLLRRRPAERREAHP